MQFLETEDCYEILAEVPSLDEDEIEITLAKDVLTVQGQKERHHSRTDPLGLHLERSSWSFCRAFRLPEEVDKRKITAEIDEGRLRIIVPKRSTGQIK